MSRTEDLDACAHLRERRTDDKRRKFSPFSIVGWLLGAASILNLVEDLTWLKLSARVAAWLSAYEKFLRGFANAFFNWIPVAWLRITPVEMHLVVICSVFQAAYFRAKFAHVRAYGEPLPTAISRIVYSFCLNGIPVWVAAWLIPEPWSIGVLIIFTLREVLTPIMYTRRVFPWSVTGWEIIEQLGGVLAVLLLGILLSNVL